MQTVALLVTGLAVFLTVPIAAFFIEVSAASVLSQRRAISPNNVFGGAVAVLVPAHDESMNLLPTLIDIRAQLSAIDRLLGAMPENG